MAVVKLKFTRSRRKIKAHLRYITHRPDKEGERQTRTIFDRDKRIEKADAYTLIDQTPKGQRFYKLIISPDPKTEDIRNSLDMWQIAKKTIYSLEERLKKELVFFGVLHSDHSQNRHVHLVFTHKGALSRADILALRQAATEASGGQLRERQRFKEQALLVRSFRIRLEPAQRRPRPKALKPSRLRLFETRYCGACLTFTTQLAISGNRHFCQSCRRVQGSSLTLRHSREAQWER